MSRELRIGGDRIRPISIGRQGEIDRNRQRSNTIAAGSAAVTAVTMCILMLFRRTIMAMRTVLYCHCKLMTLRASRHKRIGEALQWQQGQQQTEQQGFECHAHGQQFSMMANHSLSAGSTLYDSVYFVR